MMQCNLYELMVPRFSCKCRVEVEIFSYIYDTRDLYAATLNILCGRQVYRTIVSVSIALQ